MSKKFSIKWFWANFAYKIVIVVEANLAERVRIGVLGGADLIWKPLFVWYLLPVPLKVNYDRFEVIVPGSAASTSKNDQKMNTKMGVLLKNCDFYMSCSFGMKRLHRDFFTTRLLSLIFKDFDA